MIEKAECTNCGAPLEVDAEKKVAICPYCNQPYIVKEAINNYTIHAEKLYAGVVNMHDDRSSAARLKAGNEFLMVKEWEKADAAFQEVCDLTPGDYKGWWGRIRAKTHDFAAFQPGFEPASIYAKEQWLKELKRLYGAAETFMPADQKAAYQQTFDAYISQMNVNLDKARELNALCRQNIAQRVNAANAERDAIGKQVEYWEKIYSKGVGDGCYGLLVAGVITAICLFLLITDFPAPAIPVIGLLAVAAAIIASIVKRVRYSESKEIAPSYRAKLRECDALINRLSTAKEALGSKDLEHLLYDKNIQQMIHDIEQEVRDKG